MDGQCLLQGSVLCPRGDFLRIVSVCRLGQLRGDRRIYQRREPERKLPLHGANGAVARSVPGKQTAREPLAERGAKDAVYATSLPKDSSSEVQHLQAAEGSDVRCL
jgi:hypothetical protein